MVVAMGTAPKQDTSPCQGRHWTQRNTIVAAVLGSLLLSLYGFRVNVEPSVPLGVYRLHAIRAPLTRGMLVLFPVPASVQRWHARWMPLLKPIVAVAGDVVCVDDNGLRIGAESYGRVYTEAGGYPLPHITGCLTVGAGEVFVASKGYRSLDSRYFGSVRVQDLTAWATPVLVWR
jgi:conjugative transfer signal peptidase TraF